MSFEHVKVGDTVIRNLGGAPMELKVTEVTETEILCGARDSGYMFDRKTGAEIDEFMGWGPPPKMTGSFLMHNEDQEHDDNYLWGV